MFEHFSPRRGGGSLRPAAAASAAIECKPQRNRTEQRITYALRRLFARFNKRAGEKARREGETERKREKAV